MSHTADQTKQAWLLPRLWGSCLLLLVAVTFRLWFPIPGIPSMPMIPLLKTEIRLPGVLSMITSTAMVLGLLLVVVAPERCRKFWWLVAASLFVSYLLDQHRLQPWAYQGAIYALVFAAIDPHRARRYLIPLAASVYIYSAAGKLDFQFAHTVGQDFLEAFAVPLGGLPADLDQSARAKIALILPATELLAGIGLLFRQTRPFAAVVVMLIHASLVAILGHWGLDHSTGVLIWNLLLFVQAYLLMLQPEWRDAKSCKEREQVFVGCQPRPERANMASLLVTTVVVAALIAPVFERSGYWDHWTSWSLYSPHTSRVDIELHRSAIDLLDPYLQSFVEEDSNQDGWQKLAIERWSLASRAVPIYPQARYQLALAEEIALQYQLKDEIRARVRGVSDRWTGRRNEQLLMGLREIQSGLTSYCLRQSGMH